MSVKKLRKGLKILQQTLKLAQNMAVAKKGIYYILFDKNKWSMQLYRENTNNLTLDIQIGEKGHGLVNYDSMEGLPVFLPKEVNFFSNPPYIGFLPEGALFFPRGYRLVDRKKFVENHKENFDIVLIYAINKPYKCAYIKLGRIKCRVVAFIFDKCNVNK